MVIAVDFDGTIVEHKYPAIGKEIIFAFKTLKMLNADGHQLILWTIRHGKELDEAVQFCKVNGVEFYAVNSNYPDEIYDGTFSRKVNADVFIDDRNVGGHLGWGEIYHEITKISPSLNENQTMNNFQVRGNVPFWKRFF